MARRYTNEDTFRFCLPFCRRGGGFSGFIGTRFHCPADEDAASTPPPSSVLLRSWHWIDEDKGLLGQVNVSSKQLMPYYLLREGQPNHYEKRFRWPWPQFTPPRLQDGGFVRRHECAPDAFGERAATVGAYVIGAGSDGGYTGFLGLPGTAAEVQRTLPEGAVPPINGPWTMELFIKDGTARRCSLLPLYEPATGKLQAAVMIKEVHTETDPHTANVLSLLQPLVPAPGVVLPPDPATWLPAGTPGKAARTFVGDGGELMTEEGLPVQWAAPEPGSGHSLKLLPDETYMLYPDNILHFAGPSVFELGCRQLSGGRGFQRLILRFDEKGTFQEVKYEIYA